MWDIICQPDVYRLTYKTVSWPTSWDVSVGLLDVMILENVQDTVILLNLFEVAK